MDDDDERKYWPKASITVNNVHAWMTLKPQTKLSFKHEFADRLDLGARAGAGTFVLTKDEFTMAILKYG